MVSSFLDKLYNLALSMPTNIVILVVICLLLVLFAKYTLKDCLKVVIGYLLICFILSMFGITMPTFVQIFNWIKAVCIKIYEAIW